MMKLKKMTAIVLSILILLGSNALITVTAGNPIPTDEKYFTFDKATQTITGYSTSYTLPKDIVIPSKIGGVAVKVIGEFFMKYSNIASVVIPTGVTKIDDNAFEGCRELKSIVIPETVTSIGQYAFDCCTGLASINIPQTVTSIGKGAFSDCEALTSINIPDTVTYIGQNAFFRCKGLTNINIPDTFTSIQQGLFAGCKGFTSITLPKKITAIPRNLFYCCRGLKSINIPEKVTFIGDFAFSECTSLKSITIPETVTAIDAYAFADCTELKEVIFKGKSAPSIVEDDSPQPPLSGSFSNIANGAKAIVPYGSIGDKKGQYNPNKYPFKNNKPLRLTEAPPVTKPTESKPTESKQPVTKSPVSKPSESKPIESKPNITQIEHKSNDLIDASIEGVDGTNFNPNSVFVVDVITEKITTDKKDKFNTGVKLLAKEKEIKELYDIKLLLDGLPVQPNGTVKVKIKLTDELKKVEETQIVYIDGNGKATLMPHTIDENYITFTTTHFSNYAVIGKVTSAPTKVSIQNTNTEDNSSLIKTIIIIAIIILILIIACGFLVIHRKQKNKVNR